MKGAYVVLTHTHVPVTEGPHKGKFQVHEMVEFVDAIRSKHETRATIIMDVKKRKFLKNRARDNGATYELIEAHLAKGYKDKYVEFLNIVGAEVPAILTEQPKVEETTEEKPKKKRKKAVKKEADEATDSN